MIDPVWQERLSAYLDGELSASERADVERALAERPELARELERYRELGARLREPVAPPDESFYAKLAERAAAEPAPPRASGIRGWQAAGLAAAALLAGALFLPRWLNPASDPLLAPDVPEGVAARGRPDPVESKPAEESEGFGHDRLSDVAFEGSLEERPPARLQKNEAATAGAKSAPAEQAAGDAPAAVGQTVSALKDDDVAPPPPPQVSGRRSGVAPPAAAEPAAPADTVDAEEALDVLNDLVEAEQRELARAGEAAPAPPPAAKAAPPAPVAEKVTEPLKARAKEADAGSEDERKRRDRSALRQEVQKKQALDDRDSDAFREQAPGAVPRKTLAAGLAPGGPDVWIRTVEELAASPAAEPLRAWAPSLEAGRSILLTRPREAGNDCVGARWDAAEETLLLPVGVGIPRTCAFLLATERRPQVVEVDR